MNEIDEIIRLRQQLEAQGFELAAVKEQLADAQRLHAMMTADMMIEFMKSSAQQECVELRQLLAAVTAGGDALAAEVAQLWVALEIIRDMQPERDMRIAALETVQDIARDVLANLTRLRGEAK